MWPYSPRRCFWNPRQAQEVSVCDNVDVEKKFRQGQVVKEDWNL